MPQQYSGIKRPCAGCDWLVEIPISEVRLDLLYTTCDHCYAEQQAIREGYNGIIGTTTNAQGEVVPRYAEGWTGPRLVH